MGELIGIIAIIAVTYELCTGEERRAHKRRSPPGYKRDWAAMNRDYVNGMSKREVARKVNQGKYDIPK